MRRIETELVSYIDKRISWDGLAQHHLQTKNARGLMVEAAKACVGIKERTGRNDGRLVELIQKTVDGKAQGEAWCFPGFIEILTEVGWQRFDELDRKSLIAQVNENCELDFSRPNSYIEKKYNGEGFKISCRGLEIYCDKGHKFFGKWNNRKNNELRTLDNCTTGLDIPSVTTISKGYEITDDQLEFIAAFISDGFMSKTRSGTPRIRIQVSKDRKLKSLDKMGYVGKHLAKKTYGKTKIPLTTYTFKVPKYFDSIFSEYKQLKWDFINSLSSEQCKKFLKYYANFDGSIRGNSLLFFSSRKELYDQLCALAIYSGHIINCTVAKSRISGRNCYRLTISSKKKSKRISKKHISKLNINEKLYCVSMPKGRIVIRDEFGDSIVVGNCMAQVQSMIAYAEFKTGVKSPLMATEHCLTLWNGTPIEQKVKIMPLAGAIAIWRHGTTTNGHTEIVLDCDESIFFAIGGNTSGVVDPSKPVNREGNGVFYTKRSRFGEGDMKLLGFIKPF